MKIQEFYSFRQKKKKKKNNNNKHIKDGQITNKNGSLNVLGSKYLGTNVLKF